LAKKRKIGDVMDEIRDDLLERNLDSNSLIDLFLNYLEESGDPEDFELFLTEGLDELDDLDSDKEDY